jgi:hypothetical protein
MDEIRGAIENGSFAELRRELSTVDRVAERAAGEADAEDGEESGLP